MFYTNRDAKNIADGGFTTTVYGMPIQVNPDIISIELGVPRVRVGDMEYPMPALSPKEKGGLIIEIGVFGTPWTSKLDASETTYDARLLNHIFTYNLLPTTHQVNMNPEMAYVVWNVLRHKPMDLNAILCTKMIKALKS